MHLVSVLIVQEVVLVEMVEMEGRVDRSEFLGIPDKDLVPAVEAEEGMLSLP